MLYMFQFYCFTDSYIVFLHLFDETMPSLFVFYDSKQRGHAELAQ